MFFCDFLGKKGLVSFKTWTSDVHLSVINPSQPVQPVQTDFGRSVLLLIYFLIVKNHSTSGFRQLLERVDYHISSLGLYNASLDMHYQ